MRLVYGFIAAILWVGILTEVAPMLSNDTITLTCAIVVAGAMAGGT